MQTESITDKMKRLVTEAKAKAQSQSTIPATSLLTLPATNSKLQLNPQQQKAVDMLASQSSFCLIGAAGTGKTTTLRTAVTNLLNRSLIPTLDKATKYLTAKDYGIALVSYTRRAVRNIAKVVPQELRNNCMTIHRLIEFQPEIEEYTNELGQTKRKTTFAPARHGLNPLPANLRYIVIDESSMCSTELFEQVLDALPNPAAVTFVFLGDLNQLPPVYGTPILAVKLTELPIVELTEVYRQALQSPIISLATSVRLGEHMQSYREITTDDRGEHGTLTVRPWRKACDQEVGLDAIKQLFTTKVLDGSIDFEDSVILCPWNKAFGCIEINKAIATAYARKEKKVVFEVVAGFNRHYFSVGDKVLIEKLDATITDIKPNPMYAGAKPQQESIYLDYWGVRSDDVRKQHNQHTLEDLDAALLMLEESNIDQEERKTQASHVISYRFDDTGEDGQIKSASEINSTEFRYALSVHKSQGSEWNTVYFVTHSCHAKMLSRELVYTAVTRAKRELIILCEPSALLKAATRPRIKGTTLADKIQFIRSKLND